MEKETSVERLTARIKAENAAMAEANRKKMRGDVPLVPLQEIITLELPNDPVPPTSSSEV